MTYMYHRRKKVREKEKREGEEGRELIITRVR